VPKEKARWLADTGPDDSHGGWSRPAVTGDGPGTGTASPLDRRIAPASGNPVQDLDARRSSHSSLIRGCLGRTRPRALPSLPRRVVHPGRRTIRRRCSRRLPVFRDRRRTHPMFLSGRHCAARGGDARDRPRRGPSSHAPRSATRGDGLVISDEFDRQESQGRVQWILERAR
jgi:hypothetical protein